jgi:DNA-binding transcriptional MerR regulator/methylmalonyl-CoA mutase cobalamin-binding subunit
MYTIKEASVRSGVGIPLLRAWERRYGVVEPTRSAGGYRLYDAEAIDRLRAMRLLIDSGWSAQQAASRIRSLGVRDLGDLLADAPPTGNGSTSREFIAPDLAAELVDRMVSAASAVDSAALDVALDEAFGSARFEAVIDRIVMPALRAIGDGWQHGRIDVSGEHAASHAILRRLSMAYEAAGDPPNAHPILVGLGPGNRHELGALAFAVAARRAGLPVVYLGPDLPAESWVAAATSREATAAVIGATAVPDARRVTAVVEALSAARPGMLVAIGGSGARRVAGSTGATELPSGSIGETVAAMRAALEPVPA